MLLLLQSARPFVSITQGAATLALGYVLTGLSARHESPRRSEEPILSHNLLDERKLFVTLRQHKHFEPWP